MGENGLENRSIAQMATLPEIQVFRVILVAHQKTRKPGISLVSKDAVSLFPKSIVRNLPVLVDRQGIRLSSTKKPVVRDVTTTAAC